MPTLALPAPSAARTRQRKKDELDRRLSTQTWSWQFHNPPHPNTRIWIVATIHRAKDGQVSQSLSMVAAISRSDALRRHRKVSKHSMTDQEVMITALQIGGDQE